MGMHESNSSPALGPPIARSQSLASSTHGAMHGAKPSPLSRTGPSTTAQRPPISPSSSCSSPPQALRSQKSFGPGSPKPVREVEEFDDYEADSLDGDEPGTKLPPIRGSNKGKKKKADREEDDDGIGKALSSWFKGLFKGKREADSNGEYTDGVASQQSSGSSRRGPSSGGPQTVSSGPCMPRSKSSAAFIEQPPATSPTGTRASPLTPLSVHTSTSNNDAAVPPPAIAPVKAVVEVDVSSPMTLKSELMRLRGSDLTMSKSFTDLSRKAQNVPKKGIQLLSVSPSLPARMSRPEWTSRDYAVVEKMYKGYASSVYKAFCKRSGELVCLKAYDMAALCELNRFQIYREVQLHAKLTHAHIIGLYGAFQQDGQVVLVQEFADGGDLFTLLHRYGGRLPERQAVELVLVPTLKVLAHLHSQGVVHRDLKPENILFTRTMGLKLCDFGLAIDLRDERAVTRAGTLEYMAPEVLECPFKSKPIDNKDQSRLYYTGAVDAWAVGVLAYELLVGRPPFAGSERAQLEDAIRTQKPRLPPNLSEGARSFIAAALEKDPDQRPTIQAMCSHFWIQGGKAPAAAAAVPTSAPTTPSGQNSRAAALRAEEGIGGMAGRMQSYTAGKAPMISHQAAQANRHMHLPHVNNPAAHLSLGAPAPNASGAAGIGAGAAPAAAAAATHVRAPEPPASPRGEAPAAPSHGGQAAGAGGGVGPRQPTPPSTPPSGQRPGAINPKLAASLRFDSPNGMIGRMASMPHMA